MDDAHLCPGVNRSRNKQATSDWVANEIEDLVKKNLDIPPKLINNSLETTYALSLPYMKLWRSHEQARNNLFGSVDDNYKWVPTLRSELLRSNSGSHVTYTYDIHDNSFRRFYVSFKVCIDGFLAGCRPLVGLDACHLKAKYLGVLLSATSLDGNNGLYPIAFVVVESESKSTWQWFLLNLVQSIGCQLDHLAFISDMEKGLDEAMKNIFPNAEHRVCIRHLWKNLSKFFNCADTNKVRSLVWTTSNYFVRHELNSKLDELLHVSPQLHSYLLALPYKWSKCEFSTDIKNYYNTNNMSESFNSWIKEACTKPTMDLVDMTRGMLMELRAERKIASEGWSGKLVPHVEEYIREITTMKEQFIIRQMSSMKTEVEGNFSRQVVNVETKECTCRFWQETGLPCIHAVAFIGGKPNPLWYTYVDDQYHVLRYRMAYEGAISALPGKEQLVSWMTTFMLDFQIPYILEARQRSADLKVSWSRKVVKKEKHLINAVVVAYGVIIVAHVRNL